MLITERVQIKWNPMNKKWYEGKGHSFTKFKEPFEVSVKDLMNGSEVLVDVQCDGCNEVLKPMTWYNYRRCVHDDAKYFCARCAFRLYGSERRIKSQLKNSTSFYDWCYGDLLKIEADRIMLRWDYELNANSPKEVSYSSVGTGRKGYWFRCIDNHEHKPERKSIHDFANGQRGSLDCIQCRSIANTHPNLVKYFVDEEDAWKYSYASEKKVPMKCPDCGHERKFAVFSLLHGGFSCPCCGDGFSFPNKFLYDVFNQLNIKFQTELSRTTFGWCDKYKYDFYLTDINAICEVHGLQHYEETSGTKWSGLKSTQENDAYKERLAKENGVENYVILDCRKSDLQWIRNSIMHSKLPSLLHFEEHDIDWLKCDAYACHSLVKSVCELRNSGRSMRETATELKISLTTVKRYSKQGYELGWL